MTKKYFSIFIMAFILIVSCAETKKETPEPEKSDSLNTVEKKEKEPITVKMKETWLSEWNEEDNIDSPAFWQNEDGSEKLVIATSKSRHNLYVYDASNGKLLKTVGKLGKKAGQFSRPNGIWVLNNLVFVVERDNHRVQVLTLPEFKTVAMLGEKDLKLPYGISIHKDNGKYIMYITDDYQNEKDERPADSLLNERVLMYELTVNDNEVSSGLIKKFGETQGGGVLRVVESIYADPENNNLLISEEDSITYIKLYSLSGKYQGRDIGKGLFKYQAEGIALYDKGNGEGYWITTDQDDNDNTFHFFDRKSFKYLGSMKPETTANTDGIWLTQQAFEGFPEGCFFAVHDDGGVGAFDWREIKKALELE